MSDKISERPSVRIVVGPAGGTPGMEAEPRRFWGLTARQRLERALGRAGASIESHGAILVRDDFIFDEMLIPALLRRPGVLLTTTEGEPVAAHLADPAQGAAFEPVLASGDSKS